MQDRYEAPKWDRLPMEFASPQKQLEPAADEIAAVTGALQALQNQGILAHSEYPLDRFTAHRRAIRREFTIPWTAISPRLQRLLYAVNAIHQPAVMVAVGVFCGFTYISNAGAGHGPGKCYDAEDLVGIEIDPEHAHLARCNVGRLTPSGPARILAVDGVDWLTRREDPVNLLYIDATAPGAAGKALYHKILQAALPLLPEGALVLAHNSENAADSIGDFLELVRDPAAFDAALHVLVDDQGLQVARR